MIRLSGWGRFLFGVALSLVWLSGCNTQNQSSQAAVSATDDSVTYTYEKLRHQGWRRFDELAPDDQAFLKRVLGTELEELRSRKLLIKKSLKSTTTPIRFHPNEVAPDKASPEEPEESDKIEPLGDYCYQGSHSHCGGIVLRVDCINDGNPFGYARQNHYYKYPAATDGWGA
ncbi:hypothetical protein [Oceanithermus sp.]